MLFYMTIRGNSACSVNALIKASVGDQGYVYVLGLATVYIVFCFAWNAALLAIFFILQGRKVKRTPKFNEEDESFAPFVHVIATFKAPHLPSSKSHLVWKLPFTHLLDPQAVLIPFGCEYNKSSLASWAHWMIWAFKLPAPLVSSIFVSELFVTFGWENVIYDHQTWSMIILFTVISFVVGRSIRVSTGVRHEAIGMDEHAKVMCAQTTAITVPHAFCMAASDRFVWLIIAALGYSCKIVFREVA